MPVGPTGGPSGGGGSARVLPALTQNSFAYWDMQTKPDGTKLTVGQSVIAQGGVKNQGYAAGLDLNGGSSNGDGVVLACSGPTGGGVDIGGRSGGNEGSLTTTGVTAPHADDDVVFGCAVRFRRGYGTGSPIVFTKAYLPPGSSWGSPYNAFGVSLHGSLDGVVDWNVNVGGIGVGETIGGRFALDYDTDYWLDEVKRADGSAALWINAMPIASFNPGLLTDYGTGLYMIGGNKYDATDSINGQIYFADIVTARLTDAQLIARAKGWLGWT